MDIVGEGAQPAGRQSVHDTDPKIKPDPKPKPRPGKWGRNAPNVPQELQDCHQQTTKGKSICWAYNLVSGCKAKAGGNPPACSRGAHVCAFCRRVGHSFQQCRSANGANNDGAQKD